MDDSQRRQRLAFLLADRDNCWARLDEATQVRIRAEGAVDGAQAVIDECRGTGAPGHAGDRRAERAATPTTPTRGVAVTPDERAEIEILARDAAFQIRRPAVEVCGATPPGYDVAVYCTREPGHRGSRHWNDLLNWPAA